MSAIDINVDGITEAITKLTAIKAQCECGNTKLPNTVGGGKTVQELEALGKTYELMNMHLSSLITSTILFLAKTKQGFEENDRDAALKIGKGGQ